MTISSHFNMITFIIDFKCRFLKLLKDRDFLFESQKLDILLVYAYIVNYNISKVFIKNNINYIINLSRKVKLKMIVNDEITKCYIIKIFKHDFVARALKRSPN